MNRQVYFVAALLAFGTALGAGAADLTLTGKNTTITFVGTKREGQHEGGFKELSGTAIFQKQDPASLKLSIEIDMESLYADNPRLTNHLKSPDFFGIKSNPKSKFVSTKVERAGAGYKITGDLTICGQTKSISIPAQITATGGALTLSGKFTIDRTQWGMTYDRGKIDDEVKLSVSISAKR